MEHKREGLNKKLTDMLSEEANKISDLGVNEYVKQVSDEVLSRFIVMGNILVEGSGVDPNLVKDIADFTTNTASRVFEELVMSCIDSYANIDSEEERIAVFGNVAYLIATRIVMSYFRNISKKIDSAEREYTERESQSNIGYM